MKMSIVSKNLGNRVAWAILAFCSSSNQSADAINFPKIIDIDDLKYPV